MNALAQPLVVAAVGFMVAGFFVAAARTSGDRRRSWIAFGCGGLFYLAAELWWGLEEALGAAPSVSLADLLWLSAFPCYFAALYLRNRGFRQSPLRAEDWIESVLVMGACALVLWEVVFQASVPSADSPLATAVTVAYPVADLGLLWLVVRSIYRYDTGWDREWTLLGAGIGMLVAGDTIWAAGDGAAVELFAQLLYVGSALAMGGAGFAAARTSATQRARAVVRPFGFEVMPYVAGVVVGLIPVVQLARGDQSVAVNLIAVGLLILVFARLALAVRENRRLREAAEREALTDGLTGLRNHSYFEERLDAEVARARRAGEPLGLLVLDIDHFKRINDTAGHLMGDRALSLLGETLRVVSRPGDVACRIGGDEFAVILAGAGRAGTVAFATRLAAAAERIELPAARAGEPVLSVSLSIGAALFPGHATTAMALAERADLALYRSKRQGRGRTTVYDPEVVAPADAEEELEAARREIRAREMDFEALFEASREPMLILADDGHIVDANPAAALLAGVTENELSRRSIFDFTVDDPAPMDRARRRHLEVGHEQGEHRIRLPGGDLRTVVFTATRVAPDRHMLVLRDVTDKRAAEEVVAASERKFRALFDNAADAIYITDDDGRIVDANAAAVELGGIAYEDLVGAPVTSLVSPDAGQEIVSRQHELLASGALRGQYDAVWPDGRHQTLEYTAVADFIPGRHLSMVRVVDGAEQALQTKGLSVGGAV